ncbi:MAG: hypothetical protein M1830_004561 [Pleopsidium flavum]|nr:MAG: hypothetical protein M1830_004561 [Pleopsidium flavum]
MAGAAKKRAQKERQAHRASEEASAQTSSAQASKPTPGGFDGPGDPSDNHSRSGSRPPSSAGPGQPGYSHHLSNAPPGYEFPAGGPSSRPGSSYGPPSAMSRPSARDAPKPFKVGDVNRRLDLPGNAYNLGSESRIPSSSAKMEIQNFRHYNRDTNAVKYVLPTELMKRPGYNTSGKKILTSINSFPILKYPTVKVYQYDVLIGKGAEKRGLIKAVWESKAVQSKLGGGWIFDGNKLAWSGADMNTELSMVVDLDAERGRPARAQNPNSHRVNIRKTGAVNLAALDVYLKGQMSFDNSVLEAINFLDHVLRETPSKNLVAIKRSFFARTEERVRLGNGVEAMKGVYQSIRLAHGNRLIVNLDVSNGTFWTESTLWTTVLAMTNSQDIHQLEFKMKDVAKDLTANPVVWMDSEARRELRRLKKVAFYVKHRGLEMESKLFYIAGFTKQNAKEYTFDVKDKNTGAITKDVSVYQYFQRRYNLMLQYWNLPLVETTKKGIVFPMECCIVAANQRYLYKLDENQTRLMIKFAVSRPAQRAQSIKNGLATLNWNQDPILNRYGIQISNKMLSTEARLLDAPKVQFDGQVETPGVSGRWDLKQKKFLHHNRTPLKSWGVCVLNNGQWRCNDVEAKNFIKRFIQTYISHGGQVENMNPALVGGINDEGKAVEAVWLAAGNQAKLRPQLLVFMVPNRSGYLRIKKSCDCRYGVVSQVMNNKHVVAAMPQYMSNVCMKVNAKLGGTTARVQTPNNAPPFAKPTLVIGADVSHAAPGSEQASMAAMTVSMDQYGARYAAACETNGYRVEMITTANIDSMLKPLLRHWVQNLNQGRFPEHIYYFRDGVSEGQYQHVLQQEVKDMRNMIKGVNADWAGKFVVVVASKRHHIRFFPADKKVGDQNLNPHPGTLVERDVTHPFEYDFYLNAHSAIQGTARPVHYHVLIDEIGLSPNQLHKLIYEHSYQYMRSTTPVSLFPAVYYAHLASNRARSHENIHASFQTPGSKPKHSTTSSEKMPTEAPRLMPLSPEGNIFPEMWFI